MEMFLGRGERWMPRKERGALGGCFFLFFGFFFYLDVGWVGLKSWGSGSRDYRTVEEDYNQVSA